MKEKRTWKKILFLICPYKLYVLCSLLCALLSVTASLLIPVFTGNVIDTFAEGAASHGDRDHYLLILGVVAVIAAAAQYIMAAFNNRVTYRVCRDMRDKVSRKMHRLPLAYLDNHPTGDLVSRMVADVDTFADGLLMGFTQLFSGVITIVAILGIMLYLNTLIALTVLILTPLSILVARFIASATHKFFEAQAAIRGEQTAMINELVEGQRVVKAFGLEEEKLAEFDEVNDKLQQVAMKATFFSSLTNPSTRLVNNIVYAVITLIGAFFTVSGGITIGQLSVFLNYASQYAKPFNEISSVVTELQNAISCAERIFDILEEADQVPEKDPAISPECKGEVELDHVAFRYVPDRPLIKDLNLKVNSGERVAIVGPTGCGKTTIINLLMRFYDVDSGEIRVDGADIRDMTRHDLRGRYGMVLQDTWLCTGTVRENIAYGKPDATEEEVIEAAKAAHADSFIRRLPKGYDTMITGGGGNLSAGQRQLLCIARAMLCLPMMLILDEATSSIDTRTEMKIQSAFAKMMKGRTSFIVAHRLSTIREADVILVMKDGSIIEQGNHKELLAAGGFYANLYNSQFVTVQS